MEFKLSISKFDAYMSRNWWTNLQTIWIEVDGITLVVIVVSWGDADTTTVTAFVSVKSMFLEKV